MLHSYVSKKQEVHLPLFAVTPCQSTRGSSSVPATAAVQPSDLLPCMRSTWCEVPSGSEVKTVFWGHSWWNVGSQWEGWGGCWLVVVTWKCRRLTVRVLPSFPEICQRIQYIWIQTELTNPHYVASCVAPNCLFQSVPALLYNKCCIYSPGKGLWWVRRWNAGVTVTARCTGLIISCQDQYIWSEAVTTFLAHVSIINRTSALMKAPRQRAFWNGGWKQRKTTTFVEIIGAYLPQLYVLTVHFKGGQDVFMSANTHCGELLVM